MRIFLYTFILSRVLDIPSTLPSYSSGSASFFFGKHTFVTPYLIFPVMLSSILSSPTIIYEDDFFLLVFIQITIYWSPLQRWRLDNGTYFLMFLWLNFRCKRFLESHILSFEFITNRENSWEILSRIFVEGPVSSFGRNANKARFLKSSLLIIVLRCNMFYLKASLVLRLLTLENASPKILEKFFF